MRPDPCGRDWLHTEKAGAISIVSSTQLQPHSTPNAWHCSRPGAEPRPGSFRREGSVFQKWLSLARESDLTLLRQGGCCCDAEAGTMASNPPWHHICSEMGDGQLGQAQAGTPKESRHSFKPSVKTRCLPRLCSTLSCGHANLRKSQILPEDPRAVAWC